MYDYMIIRFFFIFNNTPNDALKLKKHWNLQREVQEPLSSPAFMAPHEHALELHICTITSTLTFAKLYNTVIIRHPVANKLSPGRLSIAALLYVNPLRAVAFPATLRHYRSVHGSFRRQSAYKLIAFRCKRGVECIYRMLKCARHNVLELSKYLKLIGLLTMFQVWIVYCRCRFNWDCCDHTRCYFFSEKCLVEYSRFDLANIVH